MVALLSLDSLIGERPFVGGERLNFRQEARKKQKNWGNLKQSERDRLTALEREKWLNENVGQVPAKTTYYEWLSTRSAATQDRVLGPERAELLRSGKLKAEDLHNKFGDPLTLAELRKK